MSYLRDSVAAVQRAILDPGLRADYHAKKIQELQREWPVLWDALEGILAVDFDTALRAAVLEALAPLELGEYVRNEWDGAEVAEGLMSWLEDGEIPKARGQLQFERRGRF